VLTELYIISAAIPLLLALLAHTSTGTPFTYYT